MAVKSLTTNQPLADLQSQN